MHPAYSVILFTTASGAGFGLLFWMGFAAIRDEVPIEWGFGLVAFGLAYALIVGGLLASTAHLGRPERAWRAFSQWRTSWLSREGVMAVATCGVAFLLALGWILLHDAGGIFTLFIFMTIGGAVYTLYTTGMIYASLAPIRQWHQPLTAPIYIAIGLASGAVLFATLLRLFGELRGWSTAYAAIALVVAAGMKWAYWLRIDGEPRTHTAGAATGLGHLGRVRALEPPHTEPNFVLREMGYAVARKHAQKLRLVVLLLGFALPLVALLMTLQARPGVAVAGGLVATLSMAVGLLVERWLFFAEAQHVVTLYYGSEAA